MIHWICVFFRPKPVLMKLIIRLNVCFEHFYGLIIEYSFELQISITHIMNE